MSESFSSTDIRAESCESLINRHRNWPYFFGSWTQPTTPVLHPTTREKTIPCNATPTLQSEFRHETFVRDKFLIASDSYLWSKKHELTVALGANDSKTIENIFDNFVTRRKRQDSPQRQEKKREVLKSSPKPIIHYKKITDEVANKLEEIYVHEVYESLTDYYSTVSCRPWKKIEKFINDLEPGSLLLDIGCGNGNYLHLNPNIMKFGFDVNMDFLKMCREQNHQVSHGQCLYLPYRKKTLDAVICIGVLHHLSTEKRRSQAMAEIMRVLRPGGKALIYVWEKSDGKTNESTEDKSSKPIAHYNYEIPSILPKYENKTNFEHSDVLIAGKRALFHHVFDEEELKNLCQSVPKTIVSPIYQDRGNLAVVCEKKE